MMRKTSLAGVLLVLALSAAAAPAAETLDFKPVRAPSMGPPDAPVTIIEIADFT